MDNNAEKILDDFLNKKEIKDKEEPNMVYLEEKNELVEKINKKYLTEDGRQLLQG